MSGYDVDDVLKNIFSSKESNGKPFDKIPNIIKEVEKLKLETKTFLANSQYDVLDILKESTELCAESKSLVDELELCKKEIEEETMAEILKSIENYKRINKELEEVNFSLNIVFDVVQCGKYVKEFDVGREAQSFTRAIEAVYDLLLYIQAPSEGFNKLDLYSQTKHTAQLILDNLLHDLFSEWDRLVQYVSKPGARKIEISITLTLDDSLATADVFSALEKSKRLHEKLSPFAQFLLKEVLANIINYNCTVFAENDDLMHVTVQLKEKHPNYDVVISNLRLLFHYLSNRLNFNFNKETLMQIIGKEIAVPFRDMLVKDCLLDTIPNNIVDLQSYGKITSEIEDFQRLLFVVNFFSDKSFSILEYVNDIDVLFAERASQHFLETARSIMLKDLSASMSIGVNSIPEESTPNVQPAAENSDDAISILEKTIPNSLFYFPRCMISKMAQELLDLVYIMMEQAVQCSDVVCKKLYNTTRLVFELYDAVVPYHHENYLHTIPQYVALFHNNCMYLAHNLQTFGDKWLILMEGREQKYPISFVDLVQKLRDLGYKYLTIHMQQQRKQILDNLRSSDLNCIVVKDVLSDNVEAAIRQCLRQLQLLKNVWIGVFPSNVFTRLMAALVNMFVDELIHRVCTVEDISMEMATQLTEIYSLVVQKAPLLFQNPADVEKHVNTWIKLQELIFVLGGSLKDIENHWKDGTGPLAVHFRTEEVRSLIKALFQNTQIRANLLSKIK